MTNTSSESALKCKVFLDWSQRNDWISFFLEFMNECRFDLRRSVVRSCEVRVLSVWVILPVSLTWVGKKTKNDFVYEIWRSWNLCPCSLLKINISNNWKRYIWRNPNKNWRHISAANIRREVLVEDYISFNTFFWIRKRILMEDYRTRSIVSTLITKVRLLKRQVRSFFLVLSILSSKTQSS